MNEIAITEGDWCGVMILVEYFCEDITPVKELLARSVVES